MEEPPIHYPHDRFFKETFSRKEYAAAFFQSYLPDDLAESILWETLERQEGTFLDEELHERSCDLLFTVSGKRNKTVLLHCLFEHQRNPDPWMPFRLLLYQVNIWKRWIKDHPQSRRLSMIFSMVLYQGEQPWSTSTHFIDLIDAPDDIGDSWRIMTPNFQHGLVELRNEEQIDLAASLTLRVILKFMRELGRSRSTLNIKKLFRSISTVADQISDEGYIRTCLTYLFHSGNLDQKSFFKHIELLNSKPELKQEAMTIASGLLKEGEARGRKEGEAQGRKEGEAQGRKEGEAQGRKEGEARGRKEGEAHGRKEGQAKLLRELLTVRFGVLPQWAEDTIASANEGDLHHWAIAVLSVGSLEDALSKARD